MDRITQHLCILGLSILFCVGLREASSIVCVRISFLLSDCLSALLPDGIEKKLEIYARPLGEDAKNVNQGPARP